MNKLFMKGKKASIGTIRTWSGGKRYKKTSQGWVPAGEKADTALAAGWKISPSKETPGHFDVSYKGQIAHTVPTMKDARHVVRSEGGFIQEDKKQKQRQKKAEETTVFLYKKWDKLAHEYGVEHDTIDLVRAYKKREKGKGVSLPIASKADFQNLYQHTTIAMISAGRNPANKADMKLTDAQIDARTKQLEVDLVKAGYVYTPAEGKYENPEKSFMVMIHDANKNEMFDLGAKYNQDSVAFADKGKNSLLMTTGTKKGKEVMAGEGFSIIDMPKDSDNYYTDISVAGKRLRFSLIMEEIKKALRLFFKVKTGGKK
jgi:hypothetical protein